jgi:hypothetical protein
MRRAVLASLIALSACGEIELARPVQRQSFVNPGGSGAPSPIRPAVYRPFTPEGPSLSPEVPRSSSGQTLGTERALREEQEFLRRREVMEAARRVAEEEQRRRDAEDSRRRAEQSAYDDCARRNRDRAMNQREPCGEHPWPAW